MGSACCVSRGVHKCLRAVGKDHVKSKLYFVAIMQLVFAVTSFLTTTFHPDLTLVCQITGVCMSISTSFGALFDLGILLFISVAFTTADIGAQTLIFSSLLLPERYNLEVFKRQVYLLAGARALFDIGSVLVIFPYAAHICEHHDQDAVTEDDTSPDADDAGPLKKKRQARSSPAFTSDDEEDFLAPRPRKTLTQTEIFNNTGLTVAPINLVSTPASKSTSPADIDHVEVNVLDSTTAINENRATIRKPRWSDIFEAPEETSLNTITPLTSLV